MWAVVLLWNKDRFATMCDEIKFKWIHYPDCRNLSVPTISKNSLQQSPMQKMPVRFNGDSGTIAITTSWKAMMLH